MDAKERQPIDRDSIGNFYSNLDSADDSEMEKRAREVRERAIQLIIALEDQNNLIFIETYVDHNLRDTMIGLRTMEEFSSAMTLLAQSLLTYGAHLRNLPINPLFSKGDKINFLSKVAQILSILQNFFPGRN